LIEGVLEPIANWKEIDQQVADMLQSFRTPGLGWQLVAEQNVFINQALPSGAARGIGAGQLAYYNEPYKTPEDRKAIWAWPQQIPVGGDPPDMEKIISEVNQFIRQTKIPKLFIHGNPDGVNRGIPMVKWFMENVKNIEFRSVGNVGHYLQEDCPEAIGLELAQWIRRLNR
jgi:haloalkane dehalogenase